MADRQRDTKAKVVDRAACIEHLIGREFPETDIPPPPGDDQFWRERQDARLARRAELQALSEDDLRKLVKEGQREEAYWWKLFDEKDLLEEQLRRWKDAPANGVAELAQKEERLAALQERLTVVEEHLKGRSRGRDLRVSDVMVANMQQAYDELARPSKREVATMTGYSRDSVSFKAAWKRLKKE